MSLDLYEREVAARREAAPKASLPEVSAFDGFIRGTGVSAMQTFAKAGRAVSMAAAIPFIAADAFTDGTEMQDRFFQSHDEIFGSAVEHWTPNPDEVGVAGQITGQLLATIPMVIASPAATVGVTGLGVAEDLVRKGVDPTKATAVGVAQAAGLGLGIYVPVLGRTLAQRVLLGGAGFNVFQGAVTRGASGAILEGTQAAKDFEAFDTTALTLDALLGSAFGAIAHLSPSARAEGKRFHEQIDAWAKRLRPSEVDALLVMRQAQHANADSLPGQPKTPEDISAHVARTKQALDQLAKDKPVDVSDLPEGRFEADDVRLTEMAARAQELVRTADQVRETEGLPPVPETEAPPVPRGTEPPPPRSDEGRPGGAEAEPPPPEVLEARRFAEENADLEITVGRDTDGQPVKMKLKQMLDESDAEVKLATEDVKLFQIAAACMLGGA